MMLEAGDSQGSRIQTQAAVPTVLKMCGSEQDATLSLSTPELLL